MTGHTCRTRRHERGTPLATLAVVSDVPLWKIAGYETGAGRLSEDEQSRVEDALDRIDALCVVLLPARIDLSNCAALREALEAYERGDAPWFREHSKPAENPAAITF